MSKDKEDEFLSGIPVIEIPEYNHDDNPPTMFDGVSPDSKWIMLRLLEIKHDNAFLKRTVIDVNKNLRQINGSVRRLKGFENDVRSRYIPVLESIEAGIQDPEQFHESFVKSLSRYNKEKKESFLCLSSIVKNIFYVAASVFITIEVVMRYLFS